MSTERAVHELRAQAPAPLGAKRAAALAVGLCAIAFVGAFAAGGVSSRVGSPPTGSFSAIELGVITVLGAMAVMGLVTLIWTRPWEELAARQRPPLWKRMLHLVLLTGALALLLAVLATVAPKRPFGGPLGKRGSGAAALTSRPPLHRGGPLDSSWARSAALVAGAAVGIVALFVLLRHPAAGGRHERPEEQLDRAIAAGIEGLESEADPRRAVIKAYAGMELALAEDGLPRSPSETPLEYLRRAFEHLSASKAATARLTALFEQAKFSRHVIDEPMRQEALVALGDLRSELAR